MRAYRRRRLCRRTRRLQRGWGKGRQNDRRRVCRRVSPSPRPESGMVAGGGPAAVVPEDAGIPPADVSGRAGFGAQGCGIGGAGRMGTAAMTPEPREPVSCAALFWVVVLLAG